MEKSKLKQLIKEEIYKIINKLKKEKPTPENKILESQQLLSLEQQAKDFVQKYGKIKIKV